MSKLDGLVLKLCIDKFAKYDLQQKAKGKIQKLDTGIEEKTRIFTNTSPTLFYTSQMNLGCS